MTVLRFADASTVRAIEIARIVLLVLGWVDDLDMAEDRKGLALSRVNGVV
jgi:hypothetical protein